MTDILENEKEEQTLALLALIALGRKEIEEGKFSDAIEFLNNMDD